LAWLEEEAILTLYQTQTKPGPIALPVQAPLRCTAGVKWLLEAVILAMPQQQFHDAMAKAKADVAAIAQS
jgi:hypothetical protein